jgi:hypothetical protein
MPAISDMLLAAGCAPSLEAIHGERILVLSGADAGKTFIGIRENESDIVFDSQLGEDARPRRMIRFVTAPALGRSDVIQTEDGKRWQATRAPGIAYLTTDFELAELTAKDA